MFKESMTDLGLLVLRLGIGGSMAIFHGWDKITGGLEKWQGLGSRMGLFGISFAPGFWGFMAAFSEFACSLLIMVGLWFKPACALLGFTMLVAVLTHLTMAADQAGAGWKGASHALELLCVYAALFLAGPGRHALVLKRKDS